VSWMWIDLADIDADGTTVTRAPDGVELVPGQEVEVGDHEGYRGRATVVHVGSRLVTLRVGVLHDPVCSGAAASPRVVTEHVGVGLIIAVCSLAVILLVVAHAAWR